MHPHYSTLPPQLTTAPYLFLKVTWMASPNRKRSRLHHRLLEYFPSSQDSAKPLFLARRGLTLIKVQCLKHTNSNGRLDLHQKLRPLPQITASVTAHLAHFHLTADIHHHFLKIKRKNSAVTQPPLMLPRRGQTVTDLLGATPSPTMGRSASDLNHLHLKGSYDKG